VRRGSPNDNLSLVPCLAGALQAESPYPHWASPRRWAWTEP